MCVCMFLNVHFIIPNLGTVSHDERVSLLKGYLRRRDAIVDQVEEDCVWKTFLKHSKLHVESKLGSHTC